MFMKTFRSLAPSSLARSQSLVIQCAFMLLTCCAAANAQTSQQQQQDQTTDSSSTQTDGAQSSTTPDDAAGSNANSASGPTRLRQNQDDTTSSKQRGPIEPRLPPVPYVPGEFERYVQAQLPPGRNAVVRRFGQNLMTDPAALSAGQDPLPAVPSDYVIKPGDEIALTVWGSIDANLRLTVDRSGLISVPRVGAINVGGLHYSDLTSAISHRIGQTFKNYELTASMGQLRPIRVFVTGYAQRPGSITVNGLSSVLHAIMRAGGPSAAGGFRDIRVTRGGHVIATFDLYDLLLRGDRGSDLLVQPDDIIFIGPIGTQVAVLGSVNQQGIFELKPGETLNDALRMAGGFNAVAERDRVAIERLQDRTSVRVAELTLPQHLDDKLATGDLVRAMSAVESIQPKERQNERVLIEGEVNHPGEYVLPPGSSVDDALRAAGGMTRAAFPYGTEFTRVSVRESQQINYDRALRELETDLAKNQAGQRTANADESAVAADKAAATSKLLERLRQVRPNGRVVLQITPADTRLPNFALEDGDRLTIPARGTSVGVFGSVFSSGSFVFTPNKTTGQYLYLAGGPTRGADQKSMFMIRANGSVVSAQQGSSFWHSGNDFREAEVEPGDTIFVPEELNKSTFVQDAKDWTQILYQFGLGVAGLKTLGF